MRTKIVLLLVLSLSFSCINKNELKSIKYDIIPENTKALVSIKNLEKFKSTFENNSYLKSLLSSNLIYKEVFDILKKVNYDNEILITFYNDQGLHFNIIYEKISIDSLENVYVYNYQGNTIISSNKNYIPKISKENFFLKSKNLEKTNKNFNISFDSLSTNDLISKVFNRDKMVKNGNLILNIDANKNITYFNGIVSGDFFKLDSPNAKLGLVELKNIERSVYFDYDDDLLSEFDLVRSNLENEIEILDFDENKSYYKVFQLAKGDKVYSLNGVISDFKDESENSKFELIFETNISNDVAVGPILVKNHINNETEIIFQDVENNIYLINNKGQVEWVKKISERLIKNIYQIDSYKNGKLQYVFTTESKMHMIDRKGRNVGKFPITFKDKITKPISVFDYDKNKNYRLLITQNDELLMYDSRGNPVKGFDYIEKSEILTGPKHFRIGNKDIIVFKMNDKLAILNRRGKIRIKPKISFNYFNSEIYTFKNSLVTTNLKNQIIKIDLNGNSEIYNSGFNNKIIVANKNNIFKIENNIISNGQIEKEIKFGEYNDLKIHRDNDKSFISFYDSQNQYFHFYDESLNMVDGFPVYSESKPEILLKNKNLEFSILNNKTIKLFKIK